MGFGQLGALPLPALRRPGTAGPKVTLDMIMLFVFWHVESA
jgi:hypothetical protein